MTSGIGHIPHVDAQATYSPRNSRRGRMGVRRKEKSVRNRGLLSVCGRGKARGALVGAALTSDYEQRWKLVIPGMWVMSSHAER